MMPSTIATGDVTKSAEPAHPMKHRLIGVEVCIDSRGRGGAASSNRPLQRSGSRPLPNVRPSLERSFRTLVAPRVRSPFAASGTHW